MPPRTPEDLSSLRVLIVDDDEDVLELLQNAVRGSGAEVVTANGVHEALERFDQAPFDVLVSDLVMPDGGGYRLIQDIRKRSDADGRFIPAIAVSSATDEGTRRTALRAGFWRYLSKPVDLGFLCMEIATVGHAYKQSGGMQGKRG